MLYHRPPAGRLYFGPACAWPAPVVTLFAGVSKRLLSLISEQIQNESLWSKSNELCQSGQTTNWNVPSKIDQDRIKSVSKFGQTKLSSYTNTFLFSELKTPQKCEDLGQTSNAIKIHNYNFRRIPTVIISAIFQFYEITYQRETF